MQPYLSIPHDFPASQERFWHVNHCKIILCLQFPHIYIEFVVATNSIDKSLIKTMKFVIMMESRHCGRTTFYSIWISNHVHVDVLMVTHNLSFAMGMSSTTTIVFQVFMIMLQSPVGKWGLSNMTQSTCVASTHQKNHSLCHNQPFDTNCDFILPPFQELHGLCPIDPIPFATNA
jgi:hypothetical protein